MGAMKTEGRGVRGSGPVSHLNRRCRTKDTGVWPEEKRKLRKAWCARRDLNPHSLRNQILSLARLPFRHVRSRDTGLLAKGSRWRQAAFASRGGDRGGQPADAWNPEASVSPYCRRSRTGPAAIIQCWDCARNGPEARAIEVAVSPASVAQSGTLRYR